VLAATIPLQIGSLVVLLRWALSGQVADQAVALPAADAVLSGIVSDMARSERMGAALKPAAGASAQAASR